MEQTQQLPEGAIEVNGEKIIASLQRQIAEQAANNAMQVAMKDSIIDTMTEELQKLRAEVDEIARSVGEVDSRRLSSVEGE